MNKFLSLLPFLGVLFFIVFSCKEKELPMKMNEPRNIRGVVSYKRSFPDLNDTHLAAAKKIGVPPVADRIEAKQLIGQLEEVATCDVYHLDSLTHSIPYLVPKANELLSNMGRNFLDSLSNKGLNPYKIIVTSVLRTDADVKRLRKGNINASANSVHRYGTTFDVSYKRFKQVSDPNGRLMQEVGADTLKLVLAEVLRDMRKAGECYVKYEVKQGCFHITAR